MIAVDRHMLVDRAAGPPRRRAPENA